MDRHRHVAPDRIEERIEITSTATVGVATLVTLDLEVDLAPIEVVRSGRDGRKLPAAAGADGSLIWTGDRITVTVTADGAETSEPGRRKARLGADVAAITDLLVEPRWGRRGHGSRLLAASVDLWREDGFKSAVASVYDADKAMRRFLGSTGWNRTAPPAPWMWTTCWSRSSACTST